MVLTDKHAEEQDKIVFATVTVIAFLLWLVLLILPQRFRPKKSRAVELAKICRLGAVRLSELEKLYHD